MAILDSTDRIQLFAKAELKRYVNKREKYCITKLKEWKKLYEQNPDLNNPEMLAGSLADFLRMNDEELGSILYGIFDDDDWRIRQYYDIIGKYFVDLEAGF